MTIYVEEPLNFNDVDSYLVVEKDEIVKEILLADRCFFYNVCAFRNHACMSFSEYICEYMRKQNGVVIITRSVLMELASRSGILESKYIYYIRKMYATGLKVLLIYEEDIFEVLSQCFNSNAKINDFLVKAADGVDRPVSSIREVLRKDKELRLLLANGNNMDGTLFRRFFQSVRNDKKTSDRLEDELVAVCVHMLANIPVCEKGKYTVLADDAGGIGILNKAAQNAFKYTKKNEVSVLTTAKLAQNLYEEGIIDSVFQVEDVLSAVAADGVVRILGSEEYDMETKEKIMTGRELAAKIMLQGMIYVRY